ncbi:MAG: gamma-glutamylcyclotransferase [Chrysiogenetes bacterium]|nr:gamma-glutamylcyclotransferase [Chrysiogenetes bacterium]
MRLFVYGTLMRGESNHRYLKSARFERAAATRAEFALADFGDYPAIVRPGSCAITGELYEIDEATLARVDELEEVPEFYERCEIVLEDGTVALTYVLPVHFVEREGGTILDHGDWRRRR